MDIVSFKGKTVIVDGSHNEQKIAALARSIRAAYPDQKIAALVSFVGGNSDIRWQRGVGALCRITDAIVVTTFKAEQDVPKHSVDPMLIARYCQAVPFSEVIVEEDPRLAFEKAMARPEPIILVVGSFYLLNNIRSLLPYEQKK